MSFPRYPKYKPSGVEWLGDVPEHWDVQRTETILDRLKSGRRTIAQILSMIEGTLVLAIADMCQDGRIVFDDNVHVVQDARCPTRIAHCSWVTF